MALFGGDNAQLNILIKARDDASKTLDSFNKRVKKTEDGFRKMATRGGIAFAAIGAGVFQATQAAVDAQETFNKFDVVFGDVSKQAEEVAQDLRNNFGLAESSAKELLASTGDMLTGFGLSGDAALDLAEKTNKLAVDLASFTNIEGGAERASKALTKALLGERESVKELGIAILEEDVKAKVIAMEVAGKFTTETERERKAIATLEIAFSQSKNAIGDYARTADGAANKQREMKERLKELNEELGGLFIPLLEDTLQAILPVIKNMTDWISEHKTLTKNILIGSLILTGFVATVGTLGLVITSITRMVLAARTAFIALRIAIIALSGPIGIIIAAVVALAAILGFAFISKTDEASASTAGLETELQQLETDLKNTSPALAGMGDGLTGVSDSAKKTTEEVKKLREEATKVIKQFAEDEEGYAKNVAEAIIAQEEKVSELKSQMRSLEREKKKADESDDRSRIERQLSELEDQYRREKDALQTAAGLEKTLTVELEEARRRAALTDFERTIEDLMAKRVARMKEHVEELQRIISERDAAIAKDGAIQASFINAQDAIQKKAVETANEQKVQFKVMVKDAFASAAAIGDAFGNKTSTPAFPSILNTRSTGGGGSFEHGGRINAPFGRSVPIIAHGGEQIIPAGKSKNGEGNTYVVHINNPVIRNDDDPAILRKQIELALRDVSRGHKLSTI